MPTVLVVEDVDDIREIVVEIIQDEGFDVLEAGNGQQALQALREAEEQPCLVLLDILMPVMDGLEFLSVLESTGKLSALPVVVVSATGKCIDLPAGTPLLRKPPDEAVLRQLVRDYCTRAVERT